MTSASDAFWCRLLRRLQLGRVRPFLDVSGGFGLPDFFEQLGRIRAARRSVVLGASARDELRETLLKRSGLLETPPLLHGALLPLHVRRSATGPSYHHR